MIVLREVRGLRSVGSLLTSPIIDLKEEPLFNCFIFFNLLALFISLLSFLDIILPSKSQLTLLCFHLLICPAAPFLSHSLSLSFSLSLSLSLASTSFSLFLSISVYLYIYLYIPIHLSLFSLYLFSPYVSIDPSMHLSPLPSFSLFQFYCTRLRNIPFSGRTARVLKMFANLKRGY